MRMTVVDAPSVAVVRRWIAGAFLIGLVVYLMWMVREIWLPLGLSLILAIVLDPVVDRMERRGWSRQAAAAFIFGSFLVIAIGLVWLAVPHLQGEVNSMTGQLSKQFPDQTEKGLAKAFVERKVPPGIADLAARGVVQTQSALSRSTGSLTKFGLGFASNLIWVVIIPIVAFYALRDFHLLLAKLLLIIPRGRRDLAQTYVAEVSAIFARYLRGLGIVSLLNGLATWMLLTALGVNSSLLIGVIAGLLYAVPYIGAFLTILITAAVSFLQGGPQFMVVALGWSVFLHQIVFDQIIAPRILGGQVGLHPILSIMALLAGNLLLGIIGMILAVPVAACIQIGVLALIPKLRAEVDVSVAHPESDGAEAGRLSQDAKGIQIAREDAQDSHDSVKEAVDEIEAKVATTNANS